MKFQENLSNFHQGFTRRQSRTLKLLAALSIAFAVLATAMIWAPADHPVSATTLLRRKLHIKFGKRLNNGKCGAGRGICDIDLTLSSPVSAGTGVAAQASPLDDQIMECVFEGNPGIAEKTLNLAEDIVLTPENAKKLGFKTLTILRGNYAIESGKGSFGAITVKMKTSK